MLLLVIHTIDGFCIVESYQEKYWHYMRVPYYHYIESTIIQVITCRNQGGILPGLDPELLLDYHSYMHWITGIKKESYGSMCPKDEVEFSKMSNQAWTCILMQTIKVLYINYHCIMRFFSRK